MGSRAGLGTASGRSRTGRPATSTAGRPTTAAGQGSGAGERPMTRGDTAINDDYIDEWDEEEYESEDDGDVFAFVPRE